MRLVLHAFTALMWQLESRGSRLAQLLNEECNDKERFNRLLMIIAFLEAEEKEQLSSQFTQLRDFLDLEGRLRRERKLPRCVLVDPAFSPWQKLYDSANDPALITVTGFDFNAFNLLLAMFEPMFNSYTPWTGSRDGSTLKKLNARNKHLCVGRPRKINAAACLGLVLSWFRFKGAEFILQGWFGFTGTPVNVWLRFGRRLLLKILYRHPLAAIKVPSDEKIEVLKDIVKNRHPSLDGVYCVADGLKLRFESCHGLTEQSMFYNGWQHDHFITNLFVFSVDGRIIMDVVNAPGCVHDSTLADWGDIYDKMEIIYDRTGGRCCVDSAFASNDVDYLIRSSDDITKAKNPDEVLQMREATSLRQAAEWGMHAIQGAFPRLKDRIHYEEGGERKVFLVLATLLYNYRVELVGLNQIRNVYVPAWSRDCANIIGNHVNGGD